MFGLDLEWVSWLLDKKKEDKTPKYLSGIGAVSELPKDFKRKKNMKCYHCDTELTWGGDQDIDEEFDHEDAHSMVTNLSCPECGTFVLVYTPKTFFDKEKYNEQT